MAWCICNSVIHHFKNDYNAVKYRYKMPWFKPEKYHADRMKWWYEGVCRKLVHQDKIIKLAYVNANHGNLHPSEFCFGLYEELEGWLQSQGYNFEKALNWIELYENAKEANSKTIYIRILLDLYSSNDLNSFINSINLTLKNYNYNQDYQYAELLYVLKAVMNLEISSNTNINLNKIFDNRSMPSIFLFNEIKNSILNNDDEKFLFYSLISLNDKDWKNLHPEHLKLILNGYFQYKDGLLFRNIILEVLKNYNFII